VRPQKPRDAPPPPPGRFTVSLYGETGRTFLGVCDQTPSQGTTFPVLDCRGRFTSPSVRRRTTNFSRLSFFNWVLWATIILQSLPPERKGSTAFLFSYSRAGLFPHPICPGDPPLLSADNPALVSDTLQFGRQNLFPLPHRPSLPLYTSPPNTSKRTGRPSTRLSRPDSMRRSIF